MIEVNSHYVIFAVSIVFFILSFLSYFKKRKIEKKYKDVIDLESEKERIFNENIKNKNKIEELKKQINDEEAKLNELIKENYKEEIESDIQSFGFYKLEYDFETSEEYKRC